MEKGRLIVIDGVDASGKSTQADIVVKTLLEEGKKARLISFPRYDAKYSAPVRMYLGGEFGSRPDDVNAYAASCFYAVDRYCSYKTEWKDLLEQGYTLIAARYTTSNAIHQGEKFKKEDQRAYFEWLYDFEFNKLGLPRPDSVIFLNMPPEKSLMLMTGRYNGDEGKKDIHEKDNGYLFKCYETACYAAEVLGWQVINCVDENGEVKKIEEITAEIFEKIK
ncbi:MAG: thymidylate kinase [Clostridia bacterium]|nr:thymidylate kinase [Clostridia bacterium]MBR2327529.1 thymidylate kinase [Clostridia bacterium]